MPDLEMEMHNALDNCLRGAAEMRAEIERLRALLTTILQALDAAAWREQEGEQVKRVCFVEAAIERIRAALPSSDKAHYRT